MDSTRSNIFVPKKSSTDNWIPEGFVVLIGPDNEKYVVPEFIVDKIDQDYGSQEKKKELKASSAPGTVSFFFYGSRKCPARDKRVRSQTVLLG